jgi:hypothetical protein
VGVLSAFFVRGAEAIGNMGEAMVDGAIARFRAFVSDPLTALQGMNPSTFVFFETIRMLRNTGTGLGQSAAKLYIAGSSGDWEEFSGTLGEVVAPLLVGMVFGKLWSNVTRAQAISEGLPSAKCWGECFAHADGLIAGLKNEGISGSELIVNPGNKWVLSDSLGTLGEQGAIHRAVRVGGTVFDNMRPGGIPYSAWIDDLGGPQFLNPPQARLTVVPF